MKIILWLALVHVGAATTDGFSTTYWERACRSCYEADPIARPFIGSRPTWPRMIAGGTLEVGAATFVGYELRKHHRKYWWVPQVGEIVAHSVVAGMNYERSYAVRGYAEHSKH